MSRKTWVRPQVESYQRLKKWYLMPPCLTLSIIRYISGVKWSNLGKGVAPSPTPLCSSYRKGSLRVTIDYGRQLYLLNLYIYKLYLAINNVHRLICYKTQPTNLSISVCPSLSLTLSLSLPIYVSIYRYVCMYVCVCVYLSLSLFLSLYIYVCVCMCLSIEQAGKLSLPLSLHTCMCIHTNTHTHMNADRHSHTHTDTLIHTRTHKHMYVYSGKLDASSCVMVTKTTKLS